MKLSYLVILIFLFTQCQKNADIDDGPCKFAPPESNFPTTSTFCTDCYVNLELSGKKYTFSGPRFERDHFTWNSYKDLQIYTFYNPVFQFDLFVPSTHTALTSSVGIKTPLISVDTEKDLYLKKTAPPPISAVFFVKDYCLNTFESSGTIEVSNHTLTETKLIQSYVSTIGTTSDDALPYNGGDYYCSGEINANIVINGKTETAMLSYKVKITLYEKK